MKKREIEAIQSLTNHSDFRDRSDQLYNIIARNCYGSDYHPFIVFGARSHLKQLELYAVGRECVSETPAPLGTWVQVGHTVTRAMPNQSAHCYRAAIDIALVSNVTLEWLPDNHPAWESLGRQARTMSLESGHWWSTFRDSAHIELPDWRRDRDAGYLQIMDGI